jgi:hypothetical protein
MRRAGVLLTAVVLGATALPVGAAPRAAGGIEYPAYHRVQPGETFRSIAEDFIHAFNRQVHVDDASSAPRTERQVRNEVRQIKILNRDKLSRHPGVLWAGERLLLAPSYWDVPDGRRGWGTGYSWCANERAVGRNRAPFAGLELSVRLRDAPIDHRTERAVLTVRNSADRDRMFWTDSLGEFAQLVDDEGRRTAVYHSDAIAQRGWTVAAHSTERLVVHVTVVRCGDTRFLNDRFGNGRYRLLGTLHWSAGDRRGHWRARDEVRVRR